MCIDSVWFPNGRPSVEWPYSVQLCCVIPGLVSVFFVFSFQLVFPPGFCFTFLRFLIRKSLLSVGVLVSVSKWNNKVAEWDSPHELIKNVVEKKFSKYTGSER